MNRVEYNELRNLIIEDKIEDALDVFLQMDGSNEVILLLSRYQAIKRELINDIVERTTANIEINNIKVSTLKLISDFFDKQNKLPFGDKKNMHDKITKKAEFYYFHDWYLEAILEYLKIIDFLDDEKKVLGLYRVSRCYLLLKKYAESINVAKRGLRLHAKDDKCHNILGVNYYNTNNFSDAVNSYKKALSINAENQLYFRNLFFTYSKIEEIEKQIILCNNYVDRYPDKSFYYYMRSRIAEREFKIRLLDINTAIVLNPYNPDYYYERAFCYSKYEQFENAIKDLDTAYSLFPLPKYLAYKAAIIHDQQRFEEAIELYTEILNFDFNYPNINYYRCEAYLSLGKLDAARNDIKIAKSKVSYFGAINDAERKISEQMYSK